MPWPLRVDEDLLDLVAVDHREADHLAVDLGDRRVGHPRRRPGVEGVQGAGRGQAVGHVPGVSDVPGAVPDVGDGAMSSGRAGRIMASP